MANGTREVRPPRPQKKFFHRRKFCRYCLDSALTIDYKSPHPLLDFVTERGKIMPRRISGNCSGHQRELTIALKRARSIALIPFAIVDGR